jgi:hypothetical protein
MASSKVIKRIVVVLIIILMLAICVWLKQEIYKFNSSYYIRLDNETTTLILGDSHAEVGLNPEFIDNSENYAMSSERLEYTYYKLNNILKNNTNVQRVVLSYSYHTLYISDKYAAAELMNRYHNLIDAEFYKIYYQYDGWNLPIMLRSVIDMYSLPIGIVSDIYTYLDYRFRGTPPFSKGGLRVNNKQNLGNLKYLRGTIKRQFYDYYSVRKAKPIEIYFLHKINKLCQDNRITLYLVNLPVHNEYYQKVPLEAIKETESLAKEMTSATTSYLNLSQMDYSDDYFSDYDHLSLKGVEEIRKLINLSISEQ